MATHIRMGPCIGSVEAVAVQLVLAVYVWLSWPSAHTLHIECHNHAIVRGPALNRPNTSISMYILRRCIRTEVNTLMSCVKYDGLRAAFFAFGSLILAQM